MQSPIPAGSVLQNRYRIIRVLGQGGFGRTYLAEDQGRFNELCALKEFIPTQSGAYAIDKSKELFQREAAILYQIQHPQIPQFRATFEENQRLFLVQDFVEGKTYRDLLNDRKAQGVTFSEAEVLQLVQQLLPVLAHIHARGIIHRDIAPDNMMLRRRDNLPVLIDFGVVKEIVTRVQSLETVPQHTTVGKLGYAPSEQMQTGNAFPSSDLYALAVTCLVLLTGREPNQMYDDRSFTWNWRPYATVSPGFGQILDRMLNYRPDQRYQNVSELAQALQALTNPAATPPTVAPVPPPTQPATPTPPTVGSQMATVAVGRRPDPNPPTQQARPPLDPIVPTPAPSIWENPLAVLMIGLGLAIVTLIGAYAVVSGVRTSDRPSPTPTPTVTPTPSPTPTPTPTPNEFTQALNLASGDSRNVRGTLQANETANYIVTGQRDETLTAAIQGEGVLMTVIAPDGSPAGENSDRVQRWSGPLRFTGDYTIRLQPVRGVPQSDYRLNVSLDPAPAPSPTPTPTPTPTPEPEPQVDTTQLNVVPGDQGVQISNRVDPLLIRRYLVNIQQGQILSAELVEPGQASLNIRRPNSNLVEDAANVGFWQGSVSETGRYIVEVVADRETNFTLGVRVNDLAPPQPQ